MKSMLKITLRTFIVAALLFAPFEAGAALRRLALVVAANDGGGGREILRYAERDAQAFGALLEQLGGVESDDRLLLIGPNQAQLEEHFREIERRLQTARRTSDRVELIFYYSGHSDENGLLLGGLLVPYVDLRAKLETLSADVRIAILDSCASGAMTRQKGGTLRAPFLVDQSTKVKGYAVLTSSSENEVAQESDRLGASFFTNYLIAGLRGAADVTGDGRVTLNEAYQFAFQETLARTTQTLGGAQHPAYNIQLVGSGDLVMTDIRSTGSALLLSEELEGRVDVRDRRGYLVVELRKRGGQTLELGMAAGEYDVLVVTDKDRKSGRVTLEQGARTSLNADNLTSVEGEAAVARGSAPAAAPDVEHIWVPFDFGIIPMLSLSGNRDRPVVTNLALSVFMSRSDRLEGSAIAAAMSWVDDRMWGLQIAGAVNVAGAKSRGGQISGAVNIASELVGAQFGGGANVVSGEGIGMQLSGGVNTADAFTGLQVSGGLNYASRFDGAQIGVINIGGHVRGAQIGVINISSKMDGAALGVLNYATEDGILNATAFTSDVGLVSAGLRVGTRSMYTLFTVGGGMFSKGDAWTTGLGLGGRFRAGERWYFDLDSIVSSARRVGSIEDESLLDTTRLLAGYRFTDDIAIYAGPSFNVLIELDDVGAGNHLAPSYAWTTSDRVRLWIGGALGIELF